MDEDNVSHDNNGSGTCHLNSNDIIIIIILGIISSKELRNKSRRESASTNPIGGARKKCAAVDYLQNTAEEYNGKSSSSAWSEKGTFINSFLSEFGDNKVDDAIKCANPKGQSSNKVEQ